MMQQKNEDANADADSSTKYFHESAGKR